MAKFHIIGAGQDEGSGPTIVLTTYRKGAYSDDLTPLETVWFNCCECACRIATSAKVKISTTTTVNFTRVLASRISGLPSLIFQLSNGGIPTLGVNGPLSTTGVICDAVQSYVSRRYPELLVNAAMPKSLSDKPQLYPTVRLIHDSRNQSKYAWCRTALNSVQEGDLVSRIGIQIWAIHFPPASVLIQNGIPWPREYRENLDAEFSCYVVAVAAPNVELLRTKANVEDNIASHRREYFMRNIQHLFDSFYDANKGSDDDGNNSSSGDSSDDESDNSSVDSSNSDTSTSSNDSNVSDSSQNSSNSSDGSSSSDSDSDTNSSGSECSSSSSSTDTSSDESSNSSGSSDESGDSSDNDDIPYDAPCEGSTESIYLMTRTTLLIDIPSTSHAPYVSSMLQLVLSRTLQPIASIDRGPAINKATSESTAVEKTPEGGKSPSSVVGSFKLPASTFTSRVISELSAPLSGSPFPSFIFHLSDANIITHPQYSQAFSPLGSSAADVTTAHGTFGNAAGNTTNHQSETLGHPNSHPSHMKRKRYTTSLLDTQEIISVDASKEQPSHMFLQLRDETCTGIRASHFPRFLAFLWKLHRIAPSLHPLLLPLSYNYLPPRSINATASSKMLPSASTNTHNRIPVAPFLQVQLLPSNIAPSTSASSAAVILPFVVGASLPATASARGVPNATGGPFHSQTDSNRTLSAAPNSHATVRFLGTGAAAPSILRSCTSILLTLPVLQGENVPSNEDSHSQMAGEGVLGGITNARPAILLDCGEGAHGKLILQEVSRFYTAHPGPSHENREYPTYAITDPTANLPPSLELPSATFPTDPILQLRAILSDQILNLCCIWISHLHADHHSGLLSVLAHHFSLRQAFQQLLWRLPPYLHGYFSPLPPLLVAGPPTLAPLLEQYAFLLHRDQGSIQPFCSSIDHLFSETVKLPVFQFISLSDPSAAHLLRHETNSRYMHLVLMANISTVLNKTHKLMTNATNLAQYVTPSSELHSALFHAMARFHSQMLPPVFDFASFPVPHSRFSYGTSIVINSRSPRAPPHSHASSYNIVQFSGDCRPNTTFAKKAHEQIGSILSCTGWNPQEAQSLSLSPPPPGYPISHYVHQLPSPQVLPQLPISGVIISTVLIHEASFCTSRADDAVRKRHSTTEEALEVGAEIQKVCRDWNRIVQQSNIGSPASDDSNEIDLSGLEGEKDPPPQLVTRLNTDGLPSSNRQNTPEITFGGVILTHFSQRYGSLGVIGEKRPRESLERNTRTNRKEPEADLKHRSTCLGYCLLDISNLYNANGVPHPPHVFATDLMQIGLQPKSNTDFHVGNAPSQSDSIQELDNTKETLVAINNSACPAKNAETTQGICPDCLRVKEGFDKNSHLFCSSLFPWFRSYQALVAKEISSSIMEQDGEIE